MIEYEDVLYYIHVHYYIHILIFPFRKNKMLNAKPVSVLYLLTQRHFGGILISQKFKHKKYLPISPSSNFLISGRNRASVNGSMDFCESCNSFNIIANNVKL